MNQIVVVIVLVAVQSRRRKEGQRERGQRARAAEAGITLGERARKLEGGEAAEGQIKRWQSTLHKEQFQVVDATLRPLEKTGQIKVARVYLKFQFNFF